MFGNQKNVRNSLVSCVLSQGSANPNYCGDEARSRYLLYKAFSRRNQLRFQVTSNFDKRQVVSVTVFEIIKSIGEGNIFYPKGKNNVEFRSWLGLL